MIDLPADMDSVVKRWNPSGIDAVAAARGSMPAGVYVTGTSGAGVSSIRDVLEARAVDESRAADGVSDGVVDEVSDRAVDARPIEWAADAASAAVVLFVLDASAPLGRRALADLAPILESTTTGLLVNKIDVHRDWRTVQRAVAESIAEFVPRAVDVSFLPVSAKLAERARIAVDPKMRAALYDESGMLEVLRFVEAGRSQNRVVVTERKYIAAVRHVAAGARQEIVNKARVVTSASTTTGLRAERARLADIRDRTRAERSAELRGRLQLVRSEVVHDISETLRQFASSARESVDAASRAELRHLEQHLGGTLDDAVSGVDARLGERLRRIDAELELAADIPASSALVVDHPAPSARRRGMEDKVMVVVGASAGVGLGRVAVSPLSMIPALDIAVIPVSLLIGAACAWWLVGSRKLVADRAHLRSWLADATSSAKSSLEQDALARILAAEASFTAATRTTARAAAESAEAELERVESELRAAAEHRAAVLAACDRDLATLDRGLERFGMPRRMEPSGAAVRLNT